MIEQHTLILSAVAAPFVIDVLPNGVVQGSLASLLVEQGTVQKKMYSM